MLNSITKLAHSLSTACRLFQNCLSGPLSRTLQLLLQQQIDVFSENSLPLGLSPCIQNNILHLDYCCCIIQRGPVPAHLPTGFRQVPDWCCCSTGPATAAVRSARTMDRRPTSVTLQVICAAFLVAKAQAACAGQPAVIANGYWDCEGTADGGMCSATCNPGVDDR